MYIENNRTFGNLKAGDEVYVYLESCLAFEYDPNPRIFVTANPDHAAEVGAKVWKCKLEDVTIVEERYTQECVRKRIQ